MRCREFLRPPLPGSQSRNVVIFTGHFQLVREVSSGVGLRAKCVVVRQNGGRVAPSEELMCRLTADRNLLTIFNYRFYSTKSNPSKPSYKYVAQTKALG